jgi:tetratricopeptide (TPR) repeat protein
MLLFLASVIFISLVLIILFIRTKSDTKRTISYRDRIKLESDFDELASQASIPKKTFTPVVKTPQPEVKIEFPKDFKAEILRFKYFSDPDDENFSNTYKSAMAKLSGGDYRGALGDFSRAIDIKKFSFQAIYSRGLVKCILNNYKDAVNDFTETIRLEIDEKNPLYFRGIAKYESKDFIGAERDLKSYADVNPHYTETYFHLGLICSKQNRFDEAIKYFSKVTGIDPYHGKAFFERGMTKLKRGDGDNCCKDLKMAMSLGILEAYHYIKENCNENSATKQ